MSETILILSRCLNSSKTYFKFHFKGFYTGIKIKEIYVYSAELTKIEKGEDYLLWVTCREIESAVLKVNLLKYKKIE